MVASRVIVEGAMLELQLDDNTLLRVANVDPAEKIGAVAKPTTKRYASRRKPLAAQAEDITFALVNSGMLGQAAKENEVASSLVCFLVAIQFSSLT